MHAWTHGHMDAWTHGRATQESSAQDANTERLGEEGRC